MARLEAWGNLRREAGGVILFLCVACLAVSQAAFAAGDEAAPGEPSAFSFNGYGTVGVVRTDTDLAQFVNVAQPTGASKSASLSPDTVLGFQGSYRFNQAWNATAQVITKKDSVDSYRPSFEWGYIDYKPTDNLSLKAGRVVAPYQMFSEYLHVGYALNWVRAPIEVYGTIPVAYVDGVSFLHKAVTGDLAWETQFVTGKIDTRIASGPQTIEVNLRDMVVFRETVTAGPLLLTASMHTAKTTLPNAPLVQLGEALRQTGFPDLAGRIDSSIPSRIVVTSLGFALNLPEGFVDGEYLGLRRHSSYMTPSFDSFYLSAGKRFDKFLPYATYSRIKSVSATGDSSIPTTGPLAPLSAAVNGFLGSTTPFQHTTGVGVRYDGWNSAAVKAQLDNTCTERGSPGWFVQVKPGFSCARIASLSVDFLF